MHAQQPISGPEGIDNNLYLYYFFPKITLLNRIRLSISNFLIVSIVMATTRLMEERYGYNSCQTDSHK